MSLDQLKKEYEELENFHSLSFPLFDPYQVSFLPKDLMDPIICFNRSSISSETCYQIKIANNDYNLSSECFPNISSNIEIPISDDIDLQDLDLLTPLFQGKEFCISSSNIQLFKLISKFLKDENLMKIYEFTNDLFNQTDKLCDLLELEEAIFDFNLDYFSEFKEKDENGITIKVKKFDKNYIARFLYELGYSRPQLSSEIGKYATEICNIIDSNNYPNEQNEKSLRDTISEYFLLQLKSQDGKINNNFLYRQFYEFNLINKDELIEALFSTVNYTLKNFTCLLWFLDILPPHMKQLMEDLMCELDMKQYEKNIVIINKIIANDFHLFKQIVSKADTINPIANAIRYDQVDQLQALLNKKRANDQSINVSIVLKDLLFEVDDFLNDTPLLNYAAFFGSIKCFKFLILNGAEIRPETFKYAICSQNAEILHIIQQKKVNSSTNLEFAAKINANNIFDWLYDMTPEKKKKDYKNIAHESIIHYNFLIFMKIITKVNGFATLKENAIKSGNYEILKFLNLISTESSIKFVRIFDINTHSAIFDTKYKMSTFSSRLKFYQVGKQFELFQIYAKHLEQKGNIEKTRNSLEKWFLKSVEDKNYFIVKFLFNQYNFVDYINNYQRGFLRCEVAEYNLPSILYLLIQNENVNVNATPQNRAGTAFTLSVWDGKFACARILYNSGKVDINAIGNMGETPLTGCIKSNKPSIAKVLITFTDVDVNKPNSEDQTPYQLACKKSVDHEILTILLSRKDLEFDMDSIKKQFRIAFLSNQINLMKAIYSHPKVDFKQINIDQLLKGKDLTEVSINTIMTLSQMIDPDDDLSFQKLVLRISDPILYINLLNSEKFVNFSSENLSQKGIFPYYHAIKANKVETIEYLLQFPEVDINAVYPKKKVTPLLQSIQTKDADFDIFRLLLSSDRLNIKENEKLAGGEINFLNLFIENKKIKELSLFIESKIKKIKKIDDQFFTFLLQNNLFNSIKLAIENGYRGQLINEALFESIKNDQKRTQINQNDDLSFNLGLFSYLVDLESKKEISIDFNYKSKNDEGRSILMETVFCYQKVAFDTLLKKEWKIDLNAEDENGMTVYDYSEKLFVSEGNDHFFNKLIQTKMIDLTKPSFSDRSLSRINLIINNKNNFLFSSILTGFDKSQVNSICKEIDLSLIMKNFEFFRSGTLLFFIESAKDRIFEKVNDGESSFIFQLIKFYLIKGDDEKINFNDTVALEKLIKLGFDVNSVDKNGETILMHAIRNKKFEAFLTLMLFDQVKLKIKNKEGKNCAQIAREVGSVSAAKTIEKMIQNGHK